ncbi:hypothetical protein [Persicobacter diffluens]|uniref:Uncharacterized protein n=1 Tax=Persicobacter diffluens TaxID=981 RepID=A0AAN4W2F2_9BACT|nr:hypothetical protein PEDI_50660 [Persicobacter diffluens]
MFGKQTAASIQSVPANIISASSKQTDFGVAGEAFWQDEQVRNGVSIDRHKATYSQNEFMENTIPASKIADLKTGEIVAKLAYEKKDQEQLSVNHSSFNCRIEMDVDAINREKSQYQPTPIFYNFNGNKDAILKENMLKIQAEVFEMVQSVKFKNTVAS